MKPVYLDNHATTQVDPRVFAEMKPFLEHDGCGNPGSPHCYGEASRRAVDQARARVASLLGASSPERVVFTSGATESNNFALAGTVPMRAAEVARRGRGRIVYTSIEHKSVSEPAEALAAAVGIDPVALRVDSWGHVSISDVQSLVDDGRCVLVSVQLANNEVGTIQDIQEIGAICAARGTPMHVDATQGTGKVPFSMAWPGVAMASISGHKMHGPKGVGALALAPGVRPRPLLLGGGQEGGLRAGTLNVAGIVGLGKACALAAEDRTREVAMLMGLRERMVSRLDVLLPDCMVVGAFSVDRSGRHVWPNRLPNNLSLMIPGIDGKALVRMLKDRVCFSTGAACGCPNSISTDVLRAMGLPDDRGKSVIRMGFSRFNTDEEIDFAAREIAAAVTALRGSRAAA